MILLRFSVPVIIAACSVGAAQSNPLDPSNPLLSGWWSSDIGVYEDAAGTALAEVGDLVQAWVDRSPNAWVLQPAAGPTRFVADSSHGLTIPALDSVTTAARLQLQDPGPSFGDPFDVAKGGELRVFFVTRTLDTFVGARILRKGNKFSGDIGWNIFHNDGAMYPRCNVNGIKAGQTKQTWPNQGDYQILTLELNDGFLFGYHNGSNVGFTHGQPGLPTVPHQPANAYQVYTRAGQVSGSSATSSWDPSAGDMEPADGALLIAENATNDFAELIIYKGEMSAAEVDIVYTYLSNKYGIALAAPATAPVGLSSETSQISVSAGGVQQLELQALPEHAAHTYLVLGSASGSSPGIALDGGMLLELVPDAYLAHTLSALNHPPLANSLGKLDALAHATASFHLPPASNPVLVGQRLHHVGLVLEFAPSLEIVALTAPLELTLIP